MTIEELLIEQNPHWRGEVLTGGVKRAVFNQLAFYTGNRFIIAISGPRRAGKSFLLLQLIEYLIKKEKINPSSILTLNFEHPFFVQNSKVEIISQLFEAYQALKNPDGIFYLFLDEVQNISGWESFVRFYYDKNKKIKFFLTGSNSRLLSSEFATRLTGRVFSLELSLFSFAEYLDYLKVPYERSKNLCEIVENNFERKNQLLYYFEKYFTTGGFSEIYKNKGETDTRLVADYARNYVKTVLYTDIVPRYGIREAIILEQLFYQIANNNGSYFSFNKLAQILKISDLTVKQWIYYLKESFLIYILPKYSEKSKEQIKENIKIYLLDPILKKPFFSRSFDDKARDIENLILRHITLDAFVFYFQKDSEIDFFLKKNNRLLLINSCYDNKIPQREQLGFTKVSPKYKNAFKLIVSRNTYQKKPILTVPIWAFLLSFAKMKL